MKSDFYIDRVDKESCKNLLYNHHYLKDESKDFKSGYNYGLFKHTDWDCPLNIGGCLAVCIFTGLPVPEIAKGAFGLESCLLYTSPSPRDLSTSRMPSSA